MKEEVNQNLQTKNPKKQDQENGGLKLNVLIQDPYTREIYISNIYDRVLASSGPREMDVEAGERKESGGK